MGSSGNTFEQFVDLEQIRQLLESHHKLSGMTYALMDPAENCLVAVGWQDICGRFHRGHPISCARCRESDAYIKQHLHDFQSDFFEYRCKNGMIDAAMPILVEGLHLATFFTGQFFYQDCRPETGFFVRQAAELGFDQAAYLEALHKVPVLSREYVRDNMLFLHNMVKVLAQSSFDNLRLEREIRVRRRAEEGLHRREQEFRAMIENSPDPTVRYDQGGRRIYVNPAFEKLIDMPSDLLLGKRSLEVPVGRDAQVGRKTQEAVVQVLKEGVPVEAEMSWEDIHGAEHFYHVRFVPEFDQQGAMSSVLSSARDIGPLRIFQRRLQDLAYYDHLTGLPNRRLFLEHLGQAVDESSLCGCQQVSLMLLDLDRFKTVNDSFGHRAGDAFLLEIGRRLQSRVQDLGTAFRVEGDAFAILLQDVPGEVDLELIARQILAVIAEPFGLEGKSLCVTASVGIAVCPKDCRNVTELVQLADAAMYRAKALGRNHFQFCSPELRAEAREHLLLEARLRNALECREFELYYQPKVVMGTGELIGAEALLRWQQPELGTVTPDRFIGIAEETGLIVELGAWVLREACLRACKWNRFGTVPLKISVNLSARQFYKGDLLETIRATLGDTGCRPEWLELEITESLLLENREDILVMLEEISGLGISIAIDDFGTGYSALGYLSKFPIHILKIDKSFVADLPGNRFNAELIKAVVSLGQALHMELVAEGVETVDQAAYLSDLGCRFAQGYLYGRPVSAAQFEEEILVGYCKTRFLQGIETACAV